MSVNHYENFPVASLLLPARIRPAVKNLYAFARTADDIADEGDADMQTRANHLANWRQTINNIYDNLPLSPALSNNEQAIFSRLKDTIKQYNLPKQAFLDLLSAFVQDLHIKEYATRDELLDYCKRSANPVGLLMLYLFNAVNQKNIEQSNAICTGLQLANFWQDITIDHTKERCYIPNADLIRYDLDKDQLATLCQTKPVTLTSDWQALIKEQLDFTKQLLITGSPLAWQLSGRIGWELRLVVNGGLRILEKLATAGFNPFYKRPMLDNYDRYLLLWRTLRKPNLQHYDFKL